MKRFVLGTAGHVDHGKTALVKALTHVETDRLPEEKRRGMTIELGFAPLRLGDDLMAGVVDVPGHQKFVDTMVAGVHGVDALVLVIAADEGICPQTREHIEIAHFLGLKHAVCALTKIDLVDPEQIFLRQKEIHEFLQSTSLAGIPIHPVSAHRGTGLEDLKQALANLGSHVTTQSRTSLLTLPVDRAFTQTGFGSIVTGTLSGESLGEGEALESWPGGFSVTVRSIEVFGERMPQVEPTARVALNIVGPERERVGRSSILVRPHTLRESDRVHVSVQWHESYQPKRGETLKLLSGTRQCEVRWFSYDSQRPELGELRCKHPQPFLARQRFVLRTPSPAWSVGGGEILDPHPQRKLKESKLEILASLSPVGRLDLWVEAQARSFSLAELSTRIGLTEASCRELLQISSKLMCQNDRIVAHETLRLLTQLLHRGVQEKGEVALGNLEPIHPAFRDSSLREMVLSSLRQVTDVHVDGGMLRTQPKHVSPEHPLLKHLQEEGLTPSGPEALASQFGLSSPQLRKLLSEWEKAGFLKRISSELYCHESAVAQAQKLLQKHFAQAKHLTIGEWKDLVQLSRKYAVPLLEFFDRSRVTLCRPDRTRVPGPKLYTQKS